MTTKKDTSTARNTHSRTLREFGLRYPGAHTKSPWPGHLDLAVNDKTFAYLSPDDEPFGISCKLPFSSAAALMLPFCAPTPYGLGKSGWVSARFPDGEPLPPVELFQAWIDESYRAQAPKKLVKTLAHPPGTLPASTSSATTPKKTSAKKTSAKKTRAKKTSAKKTRVKKTSAKKTPVKTKRKAARRS